jgi:zinc transporter ZupT
MAGLSTGIGSAIAFFAKKTNTKFLSLALGFSAGVMLYVSFVEIIAKSKAALIEAVGVRQGNWMTVAGFFAGILIIGSSTVSYLPWKILTRYTTQRNDRRQHEKGSEDPRREIEIRQASSDGDVHGTRHRDP